MGQKPSGSGGAGTPPASPRNRLQHHTKKIGAIANHGKKDAKIIEAWASARFSSLTNLIHDSIEVPTLISANNFDDPLMQKIFQYIALKELGKTTIDGLNKEQFVGAMVKLSKLNENQMMEFIVDAMLFSFNSQNRRHPDTIDAHTLISLVKITPDNYNISTSMEPIKPEEIAQFFESNTGKETGSLSKKQCIDLMKIDLNKTDFTMINDFNLPLKPPHLHPSPRDKGWSDPLTESESDSDDDSNNNNNSNQVVMEKNQTYTVNFITGSLGMTLNTSPTFASAGCLVNRVVPNSQAAKATVQSGHQIIAIEGVQITGATQAMQMLKEKPRPVSVVFKRNGIGGGGGRGGGGGEEDGNNSSSSNNNNSSSNGNGGGSMEAKPQDMMQKKVLIMKKIRDKKVELMQTTDPGRKKLLNSELEALMKRLQALDGAAATGAAATTPAKSPPTKATPTKATPAPPAKEEKEEEFETYTFQVKVGPIGLGLVPVGNEDAATDGVKISRISAGSQASNCDEMGEGDILTKINTIDLSQKNLASVMTLLKETKRPFVLTFRLGDEDDSD